MKRAKDAQDDSMAEESSPKAKRPALQKDIKQHFHSDLFNQETLNQHKISYVKSTPYKHGVIQPLLDSTLLQSVRHEIQNSISFTPKETDIYKIYQSGDLANLDGLDDTSLSLLPSLVTLRNALYSAPFREYLSDVTGSGPLSGNKTDMAVNVYTPGCHLLCHDDVIGSRRVSYILYLTDPDKPWRPEWGGALRLYPTKDVESEDGSTVKVPWPEHAVSIPPAFNQLSFFAVQPGESFHDVEEVYADAVSSHIQNGDSKPAKQADEAIDGGRIRMAISGWYHIPQPGEPNHDPTLEQSQAAQNSSLAQLQGKADAFDLPKLRWLRNEDDATEGLTESDFNFLLRFMNPRYLVPDTVTELAETFAEDSSLRLALFLSPALAEKLKMYVTSIESSPPSDWTVARPPHKHRFLYLQSQKPTTHLLSPSDVAECQWEISDPLTLLNSVLFPSRPFHKWLALATGLSLTECATLARRFRRGMDYTLATGYDELEPRLEACLGITPTKGWGVEDVEEADEEDAADEEDGEEQSSAGAREVDEESRPAPPQEDTSNPSVGGYEAYMSADDPFSANPASHTGAGTRPHSKNADPAVYHEDDDEDDGMLFTQPAGWNTLSLVLRDQGTLRFVKYISAAAAGDRWDVVGFWGVDGGNGTAGAESDDAEADGEA